METFLALVLAAEKFLIFAAGVGATLAGTVSAEILTLRRERRTRLRSKQFEIYMRLLDLNADYFWWASAEFRGEPVPPEIKAKCRDHAWRIADLLRSADDSVLVEETLDVLQSTDAYPTAQARHDAMGALIDRMGKVVNPTYAKKVREISDRNVRSYAAGNTSSAPALF
jgi:hypothetical protein